jgi:hypothetical protein
MMFEIVRQTLRAAAYAFLPGLCTWNVQWGIGTGTKRRDVCCPFSVKGGQIIRIGGMNGQTGDGKIIIIRIQI